MHQSYLSNGTSVLIAYTCRRQKSKEQTYILITYTCGGQKSIGCAYTLVTYTCGGQKSGRHAYTVIAYTCGGQKSKVRVPECPRIPFYSGVPNKRVVPNSHAGGKTSAKILSVHAQISVQGGEISSEK